MYEDPPWPDYPLKFEFETNEEVGAVEAYYNDLAKAQGWQPVTGMARQHYYYGDHGREHIYGYYLGFFAADGGNHLRTYVSVWIVRSLPVYRGATDVIEGSSRGVDDLDFSVEFLTEAQPATVLAFYKELLPEIGWNFQPEESSRMRLFWKTGKRTSHAEVFAQPQPSGKTRVKVKTYYGCCGG
ncbi:MAG TPA: hypothetical protein VM409_07055 [Chloroflexia bacterium]|nr:hypothetical protein [Chloroflexia bacterium]